jgi:hypothetical protein
MTGPIAPRGLTGSIGMTGPIAPSGLTGLTAPRGL